MRRFTPDALHRIGCELFQAAGCAPEDAETVVDHLVESNLFGQDAHGTLRYYEYVEKILEGNFDPKGKPSILQDRGCTALIDGGGGFGQVSGRLAIEVAIAKAREHGVGVVGMRNTSHVGRAGAYPLAAAREGFLALAFVNAGRLGRQIAPFGGIDGKLSTNPIAFAAPRPHGEPILVDMTTSIVAEGKIRMAQNKGELVPEGWIIDSEGNPTTDPVDYLGDPPGAMLPLGGTVGYKGYSLGIIVELMGGLLGGEGTAAGERSFKSNGLLFTAYDPGFFTDKSTYEREIEGLVRHVTSSRPDPRFGEVLLPGELEFRTASKRRVEGLTVDDGTWQRITNAARRVGLDPEVWEADVLS